MPVTVTIEHAPGLPDDLPEGAAVALGVRVGHLADDAPGVDSTAAALAGFEGKVGQVWSASVDAGIRLLVGLGAEPDPADFRKIGAATSKAAAKQAALHADLLGHLDGAARAAAAEALTQGLILGTYRFTRYKAAPEGTKLAAITVVGKGGKGTTSAVDKGTALGTAMVLTRDLVNTPGGDLTPKAFAAEAQKVADAVGLEIEILDKAAIKKAKLGGLLGVNRGSTQEPRFVKLTHRPEGRPKGKVALVGKGITFDAGGLSIKPTSGMEWMKGDMGGAATVLGAMSVVPLLAPRTEVVAYLPLTDNMLGGDATRVGDVLTARNGKTMEVLNTDAEGRLILADALSLAVEDEPDAIIDLATLTGACMVALGDRTAGAMGNNKALSERVLEAAGTQGEAMWPLPLPDHLRKAIESEIADLRNIATTPYGGALSAGLFLEAFVDDVPWLHLDIAGPSDTPSAYDENARGGTGFGVRTLIAVLAGWTKLPAT
ncbi:leucyl aminopeptidase [Aquihabitans sp. McL0605]|uniref:leucyl aminopeptidase n=1 Tax=Aquihabitans sp. McL0605 TaxID=3415671 RepID=UPI003CF225C7